MCECFKQWQTEDFIFCIAVFSVQLPCPLRLCVCVWLFVFLALDRTGAIGGGKTKADFQLKSLIEQ